MRLMKRGLAVLLAAMLAMQTLPVMATEGQTDSIAERNTQNQVTVPENDAEEQSTAPESDVEGQGIVPESDAEGQSTVPESDAERQDTISGNNAEEQPKVASTGSVFYNTGDYAIEVCSRTEGMDEEQEKKYFAEDGSYTIQIPEEDPFFPYEVQFTYGDVETREWFMTPDDTVEIDGHVFSVNAVFHDDEAITGMSLKAGDKTVIVYPEEKDFSGASAYSLLPLEEKYLTADFKGLTPIELTMVSIGEIFTKGRQSLGSAGKVAWTRLNYESDDYSDDFKVSAANGTVNASKSTYSGESVHLELIVGDANQLNASNIRYRVQLNTTKSENWLTPTVYKQDAEGNRTKIDVARSEYEDYNIKNRYFRMYLSSQQIESDGDVYVSFAVDSTQYTGFDSTKIKVFEGKFDTVDKIGSARDITTDIFHNASMGNKDSGYKITMSRGYVYSAVTAVYYDARGNVIGCLPFELYCTASYSSIYPYDLFLKKDNNSREYVDDRISSTLSDGIKKSVISLYKGYSATQKYYLTMNYSQNGESVNEKVTAAFEGRYESIAAATAAGKPNIWPSLRGNGNYATEGYEADYSGEGVTFSVFVGEDNDPTQEKLYCIVAAVEGTREKSNTNAVFYGLNDGNKTPIKMTDYYCIGMEEDSYADFNYQTFLVADSVDITSLAPTFYESTYKVYAGQGTGMPVKSGENPQDFSQGPVQYTVASQNGREQKNYWLQVIKQTDESDHQKKLYINSLKDPEARTSVGADGVTSTREMVIDSYHNDVHDILLVNTSRQEIPGLKAELDSATVVMDDYWKLDGSQPLGGLNQFTSGENANNTDKRYGELPNLAKIRLRGAEGVSEGTDISGTLTIKSGDTVLVKLTLTGTLGDPTITTTEIPQAVKYVPYGIMFQNNNKYSRNRVSYELVGTLPSGMELKENGELYGVPKEAGTFPIQIRMRSSLSRIPDSTKQFTLEVLENTDENVNAATDEGYALSARVANITMNTSGTQTITSAGELAEFQDIYLDGDKLTEGTDYTKESGSTKITIQAQTLKRLGVGTHTLGMEFRKAVNDSENRELKRAAQNYAVNDSAGSSGGNGGSGSDDSGDTWTPNRNPNSMAANAISGSAAANANTAKTAKTVYYTVQAGDTLSKIAKRFYGRSEDWRKIYAANKDIIKNPNLIRVGQVLTIYLAEDNSIITVPGDTGNGEVTYYTVQSGDTLWKIAKKFYGKGRQWRKIYQDNADTISDPGKIHTGQVIIISGK